MDDQNIIEKSLKIVKKYPLCDHCLGSLFARLGKGLGNEKRGAALRRTIIMEMDRRVREGIEDESSLVTVLGNLSSEETKEIAIAMNLNIHELKRCYVCGNNWNELVKTWSKKILDYLDGMEFESFVVGCTNCGEMEERHRDLIAEFKLPYAENIKNSFKREIGKILKEELRKEPDFVDPDITIIIDLKNNELKLQIKPIYVYGIYKKLSRRCSQSIWKYECSVEGYLQEALNVFQAKEVVLHAAGREDVDVRTLGSGRPFIAKVVKPKRRYVDVTKIKYSNDDVYFEFIRYSNKDEVPRLKGEDSLKEKTYFAVVQCTETVTEDELKALEDFFQNTIVSQQTPTRVLHRRKDMVRTKKVYWVKAAKVDNTTFISLIKGEGGLYIKELISGDNGRTEPSFSSFLSKECKCVSLDVVWIEKPTLENT
ncbi:hypothetical protein EYM_07885 [Ignicoccus islandicus DSM 13165]|uniref:tRNA pseudouridine(55) synthase n=1 Tax=Ignicoccus islandicus DSM 13165 TaxID=940295 RepID=A0A0U3G3S1_9CREN|nr:tRNA pseudouridine(54/55) synthase Pus10 [Ignicoccus islandicus]ALU12828.1 hypothetical protein EYM_07885 [Ignicoccus islandicus DSM 13165]